MNELVRELDKLRDDNSDEAAHRANEIIDQIIDMGYCPIWNGRQHELITLEQAEKLNKIKDPFAI